MERVKVKTQLFKHDELRLKLCVPSCLQVQVCDAFTISRRKLGISRRIRAVALSTPITTSSVYLTKQALPWYLTFLGVVSGALAHASVAFVTGNTGEDRG